MRLPASLFALLAGLLFALGACDSQPDGPYFEFLGGGFVFNYNVAEAYYGFVVRVRRDIPEGAVLQVEFDNPAGGPPLVERHAPVPGRYEYSFRSPALTGIVAGREYRVALRLVDTASGRVIASQGRSFHSDVSQDMLPQEPTTLGPGYQPNPDSRLLFPHRPPPQ